VTAGDRARDARNWPDAARHYREALELSANDDAIWVQLGHALKESGDLAGAEAAYRQAVSIDSNVSDTYLQLGHVLKIQNRKDEAASSYLKALSVDPKSRDAYMELRPLGYTDETIAGMLRSSGRNFEFKPPKAELVTDSIVFDVSDLMHYFFNARIPTGIQRVQINVIASTLAKTSPNRSVSIACFSAKNDNWIRIEPALFLRLSGLAVVNGDKEEPAWLMALGELSREMEFGQPFVFAKGASLVNLGTSWWLQNYFLMVRQAKAQYGIRYIPFVHDCIPILTPEHCVKDLTRDFISWLTGVFFHADGYIVNSNATANDLKHVAGLLGHTISKPHVVRLDGDFGAQRRTASKDSSAALARLGLDHEPFVLFVSTIESRKNHLLAFSAWLSLIKKRGLQKTPTLVCVGNDGWMVEAALARLRSSDLLQKKVLLLSKISDATLNQLYENCLFTIFPSSYEGWGLPVTESLCHGKVPLIANVSSLPEAGGAFAEYFDLQSEREFLERLEHLIDDRGYRERKEREIIRDFRPRPWEAIADEIVEFVVRSGSARNAGENSSDPGALITIPAESGRFYSFARNRETRVWRGMASGEMFRVGSGWLAPEEWGTWVKNDVAEIAFKIAKGIDQPVVYMGLRGFPRRACDFTVGAVDGTARVSGRLERGGLHWLRLDVPKTSVKDGTIHLRVVSREIDDESERKTVDGDRAPALGVIGFYYCGAGDVAARHEFIEALQLKSFSRISGREDDMGDRTEDAIGPILSSLAAERVEATPHGSEALQLLEDLSD
jgi:glycosyltransferase involved in cell wall biosynthesis